VQDKKPSSASTPEAVNTLSVPTPSPIPQRCPEFPIWPMASKATKVHAYFDSGNDYFGEEFYEIRQTGRTATTFSV